MMLFSVLEAVEQMDGVRSTANSAVNVTDTIRRGGVALVADNGVEFWGNQPHNLCFVGGSRGTRLYRCPL